MKEKQNQLAQLKKRLEALKPVATKAFKTDEELDACKNQNRALFEEYYAVAEEVGQLEYNLLAPGEKEKQDKAMRFLGLKATGQPFDVSGFEDLNG